MVDAGITRLIARHIGWLAPLVALLVFGSWSYWVHLPEGIAAALRAGLTQGAYAVLSTVALRSLVVALYAGLGAQPGGLLWTYLISVVAIIVVPATLHTLLGNLHVWLAIAPGVAIGMVYIGLTLKLERVRESGGNG